MLVRSGREKNLSSSSKHISRRSRERCNERRESSLGGQDSGKIPKPISLIRQKFPRLRWHEWRKREREEVWTSAKGGRRAQPRERIVMVHDAFRPSRSSIFIYSTWKYSASIRFEEKKRKRIFFEHLCHPFQTFCLCNLSLSLSLSPRLVSSHFLPRRRDSDRKGSARVGNNLHLDPTNLDDGVAIFRVRLANSLVLERR